MSALTDLFTALATKIRSKTGGSDTYTPPQMVNAIDDVYQAGVDAGETTHTRTYTPAANTAANDMGVTHDYRYVNTSGMIVPSGAKSITANGTGIDVSSYATANVNVSGTSITPSNTIPASMSGGTLYTPSASGYAISSYDNVGPSGTPLRCYANEMVRFENAGYIIDNYQNVSPSDVSPTSLTTGNIYKPDAAGYFIGSYSSVSPSSTGTYFSGGMKRMVSSGYAYSGKPQMTETTLWTNSNVANTFASQTITLSDSISNYDYIKVTVASSTTNNTEYTETIFKVSDFITYVQPSSSVNHWPQPAVGVRAGGASNFRALLYVPDNQISISNAVASGTSSSYNTRVIPVKVTGMKL